jgi:hypothetical protein
MKTLIKREYAAFTLTEMMMSVACGTLILAAIVAAGVSLQKSYAAMENYSTAQGNELRVLDYVAMDCRRATSASVGTVTVNNGSANISENQLILTLPQYYSAIDNTAVPNTPVLTSGAISYGSGNTITIKYYVNYYNAAATAPGNIAYFVREVVTATTDNITPIARNVATFTVTDSDLTNWVSCNIMFFPTFLRNAGNSTWRSGATNPDTAPDSSVGSNGDWYVINTTATDPTTVGNVYFKSGGSYSLVQNEKATTVACKTFLRNASARH